MIRQDILHDELRLLYDDGTQGVLCYGEALSRSNIPVSLRPENLVGLTLKKAKMKLGVKT